MNGRALWPANVAAAAVLIGGVLIVALPQHALTIVQLVIVTTAVSVGVYALAVNVHPTGWISPFKWLSPFSRTAHQGRLGHRSDELDWIRAKLSGRRQHLENAPPMPPPILRQLKPLIAAALDLDLGDEPRLASARGRVSPLTFSVLTSEPLDRPSWFRMLPPNEREVAETVHRVLDDLDRLNSGNSPPATSVDSGHARAT